MTRGRLRRALLLGVFAAVVAPLAVPLPAAQKNMQEKANSEKQIPLVKGLDGATYEAYLPSVVKEVQQALKTKDLYQGKVDGVLDHGTEEAIGKFQKENHLMADGIPSPDTRKLLLKG